MVQMRVNVDMGGAKQFADESPTKVARALLRSISRGTMSGRTEAARSVSRDMGLKVGDVRRRIEMRKPSARRPEGRLAASLRRLPLVLFGAKGPFPSRGRGRLTVKTGGRRKHIPGAFFATVGAGHRGVFKRVGRAQYPIRELYGPSIGRVFAIKTPRILNRAAEVAQAELKRQLDRMFGPRNG